MSSCNELASTLLRKIANQRTSSHYWPTANALSSGLCWLPVVIRSRQRETGGAWRRLHDFAFLAWWVSRQAAAAPHLAPPDAVVTYLALLLYCYYQVTTPPATCPCTHQNQKLVVTRVTRDRLVWHNQQLRTPKNEHLITTLP